jgi:predicted MFS family arabinose efflux permease
VARRTHFVHRRPFMNRPKLWLALVMASAVLSLAVGLRQSLGLFFVPMAVDLGVSSTTLGLAIALQNLMWGATQPFAGMLADRFGTGRVLVGGTFFYAVGLFYLARANDAAELYFASAVLIPLGLSGAGLTIVLGAVARIAPPERRSMAAGIASAGGSFGQFMLAPMGQRWIANFGWSNALLVFAGLAALMAPLAFVLRGRSGTASIEGASSIGAAFRQAFRDPSFWLLNAGFFVCGFHIAFVSTYLPGMTTLCLLPAAVGAEALSLIGLFNMLGSFLAGYFGGFIRMKYLLSGIYLIRAVAISIFLMVPKSRLTFLVFAAILGMTWLGTVPLTSGLVGQRYGTRYLASLFGVVFFSHQIGAFFGAWSGGRFYDLTGKYDMGWQIAMSLALAAAFIHLPIRDRSLATSTTPVPAL